MMNQRRGLHTPKMSRVALSTSTLKSPTSASSKPLAEETFVKWQSFIEAQVGFVLPKNQTHWLWHAVNRLSKEERTTQIDLLNKAIKDNVLKQKIIDAVLIPQSRFFRHQPSLTLIADRAKTVTTKDKLETQRQATLIHDKSVNSLSMRVASTVGATGNAGSQYTFKVWSVGCSHGQEVWSIAMVLSDLRIPYQVWGADVNESALKHAESGYYNVIQLDDIPNQYRQFITIKDHKWSVSQTLRRHIQFLKYNLFEERLPLVPNMDVIICQNVLIYFRQFDQRDILSRLVSRLEVGGYLILAPGEASQWHHPLMQKLSHLQVNAWQRVR